MVVICIIYLMDVFLLLDRDEILTRVFIEIYFKGVTHTSIHFSCGIGFKQGTHARALEN